MEVETRLIDSIKEVETHIIDSIKDVETRWFDLLSPNLMLQLTNR